MHSGGPMGSAQEKDTTAEKLLIVSLNRPGDSQTIVVLLTVLGSPSTRVNLINPAI